MPRQRKNAEAEFASQVIQAAKLLGYSFIYHTYISIRSAHGYPDLTLVRNTGPRPTIRYIELKTDDVRSKVSDEQQAWIDALNEASLYMGQGDCARVFRPSQLEECIAWLR